MKSFNLFIVYITMLLITSLAMTQDLTNTTLIPVDQGWMDSSIPVHSGERISIWGFGWACFNSNTMRNLSYAGPGGTPSFNPSHPVPDAPTYALCAKVGTSGTPFGVGTYWEFTATSNGNLYFRVNDLYVSDNQGFFTAITAIDEELTFLPQDNIQANPHLYNLQQNYPNPFNPSTTINYSVEVPGEVTLKISNNLGQLVRTLVDEEKPPGEHTVVWDGTSDNGLRVATGTYFYQLQAGEKIEAKKMILLK